MFKRKSEHELKRELMRLKREERSELKRKELLEKRRGLERSVRDVKYREAFAAGRATAGFLGEVGRGIVKVGIVGAHNLSKHDVSPKFKSDFPAGRMVTVPRVGGGGLRLGSGSSPRLNLGATKAFSVHLKKK